MRVSGPILAATSGREARAAAAARGKAAIPAAHMRRRGSRTATPPPPALAAETTTATATASFATTATAAVAAATRHRRCRKSRQGRGTAAAPIATRAHLLRANVHSHLPQCEQYRGDLPCAAPIRNSNPTAAPRNPGRGPALLRALRLPRRLDAGHLRRGRHEPGQPLSLFSLEGGADRRHRRARPRRGGAGVRQRRPLAWASLPCSKAWRTTTSR